MLAETFLGTLWGPNTTSLCSRCAPWVCNFCRNILSGVTQCTWLGFIDLIYGPVTSKSVFPAVFFKTSLAIGHSYRAFHSCLLPTCLRFKFPTSLPLSCLLRIMVDRLLWGWGVRLKYGFILGDCLVYKLNSQRSISVSCDFLNSFQCTFFFSFLLQSSLGHSAGFGSSIAKSPLLYLFLQMMKLRLGANLQFVQITQ